MTESTVHVSMRAENGLGCSYAIVSKGTCAVLILLRLSKDHEDDERSNARQLAIETDDRMYEPKNDTILQHIAKVLVPIFITIRITCLRKFLHLNYIANASKNQDVNLHGIAVYLNKKLYKT